MLKTTCFAVLLISATAAGAQSQSAPANTSAPPASVSATATTANPAAPDPNKSDLNRVVCEKQDKIGTRLGAHKVCMTVAQWAEFRKDVQDQTQHIQQNIGIVSH